MYITSKHYDMIMKGKAYPECDGKSNKKGIYVRYVYVVKRRVDKICTHY